MITQHQHHSCRFRFPPGPALCVLALASVLIALPASAASYAGRAVGAYVNVPTAGVGPLYLSDTGLLCALLNLRTRETLLQSPAAGQVWETFVFAQLRERERRAGRFNSLFFWRDRTRRVVLR